MSAVLDGGDLVDIQFDGVELVRRVGVRVRDTKWGTVPPDIAAVETAVSTADLQVRHAQDPIDFSWRGRVELEPRTVTYMMEGRAACEFAFNRIGIVVLHPVAQTAGCRFRAHTATGAEVAGELPRLIGPQAIENGQIQPLFPAFTRLEVEPEPGLLITFKLEGDVFEMEDQRNWTDGSFKTYSTPVGAPVPHHARAGQLIAQRVSIEISGTPHRKPRGTSRDAPSIEIRVSGAITARSPAVGIGLDADGHSPDRAELHHLRSLHPAHLRAEVIGPDDLPGLACSLEQASAVGAPIELSLTLRGDRDEVGAMLCGFSEQLRAGALRPARVLVFHEDQAVTAPQWLELARKVLRLPAGVPLVGGTSAHFAELNRERPAPNAPLDGVAYSITPQVHDFDDASIVQTLSAQGDTVRTAQSFAGGRPIHVSPVTLRPRPAPNTPTAERAKAADPRQSSLLTAAFTVGSAKALAEAGVASITYYEATGPFGLMQRFEESTAVPVSAPSPREVFPVYHVLRSVCGWQGANVLECRSSNPAVVEALAVRDRSGSGMLLANLTPAPVHARVGPLPVEVVLVRCLDADNAADASRDPAAFWATGESVELSDGWLALGLSPYAVATVLERRS